MKRLLTGAATVAIWLTLLFAAPFSLFWLFILALCTMALLEYLRMVLPGIGRSQALLLAFFGLAPVLAAGSGHAADLLVGLVFTLISLLLYGLSRYPTTDSIFDLLCRCGFGYLLISLCSAHLVLLAALPQGRYWLLLLTAITAAADTCAFYTGSLLGRHKLCPSISPKKTWEGFWGGLIGSLGAAILVAVIFLPNVNLGFIAFLAALLSCLGTAGDLVESLIKRSFQIKDSGRILPGHGGLLDRIDSLLLAAPFLYCILSFQARMA